MLSFSPVDMQIRSLFLSITNVIISIHFEVSYAFLLRKYGLLLYLLVSTRAVIGQFSGPYSPVRPAKI